MFQFIDITGKVLFEKSSWLNTGENMLNYTFPAFYKGMYFLKIKTSNGVWNQKIFFE